MSENNDTWAIVEMMGHLTIAGRVTRPGEYGGLWQIDIPEGDTYQTQFFGSQSVYRIRIVSEEIARAYAQPGHEVIEYDAPIVTRAEHERAMDRAREENMRLRHTVSNIEYHPLAQSQILLPSVFVVAGRQSDKKQLLILLVALDHIGAAIWPDADRHP